MSYNLQKHNYKYNLPNKLFNNPFSKNMKDYLSTTIITHIELFFKENANFYKIIHPSSKKTSVLIYNYIKLSR